MNVYTGIECTSMIATNAGKNSRSAVRKGKMIVSGWQPREEVGSRVMAKCLLRQKSEEV